MEKETRKFTASAERKIIKNQRRLKIAHESSFKHD